MGYVQVTTESSPCASRDAHQESLTSVSIRVTFATRRSDRYGRRKGYLATAVFTAVFGLLSAASPNVWFLIVMRLFVGFGDMIIRYPSALPSPSTLSLIFILMVCLAVGLGGAPVAFSLFAEFVPTAQRGQVLVLLQATGVLLARYGESRRG